MDRSFGAALRRLRLQRGLGRAGFAPDVSEKTVARVERNEVNPRGRTLAALARRLRVKPSDIASY